MDQLALVSAVLGGFAFTFTTAIVTLQARSRVTDWTLGLAVSSAAAIFVCALGWTLMTGQSDAALSAEKTDTIAALHRTLSLTFLSGVLALLGCIGLSGWIRSKGSGVTTTVVAAIAFLLSVYVLSHFWS